MFVKYQFYDKPPVYTPPPQTLHPRLSWNHTTVLLLGTIESELLLEYLRGPPLAIEVHNGDKGMESQGEESRGDIFGSVWSDPLLGTCTYVKGMNNPILLCTAAVHVLHVYYISLCNMLIYTKGSLFFSFSQRL